MTACRRIDPDDERFAGRSVPPRERNAGKYVRIILDRHYVIGFASSSVEDWLGIDYEAIAGKHIFSLLPELKLHLVQENCTRTAMATLHALGDFTTYARHGDSHDVPVTVALDNEEINPMTAVMLMIRAR
jgi:hypothetical protein